MADKLTLRLKEELERRHGKGAVSDAQIKNFLDGRCWWTVASFND